MEGSTTENHCGSPDKPCEWCHDTKADYVILKWNIEVLHLHTNKLHRDNGPQIRYVCADCLAYNGFSWDNKYHSTNHKRK